jgi:hypothetical protein
LSHNESCPDGRLCVLCGSLLLYERVERDVYGFGVKDVEITEVAEKAEITEVAEMAEMFRMIIWMTARHVIQPLAEKAEAFSKTARHVM